MFYSKRGERAAAAPLLSAHYDTWSCSSAGLCGWQHFILTCNHHSQHLTNQGGIQNLGLTNIYCVLVLEAGELRMHSVLEDIFAF